uniref:Aminotransferase-like protein n=1 Tax=Oryza sativa subsp. japonica TaxID=39947 RepID=Q75H29_ORYSJ|nr:hypothetical protein [Oryza sativa Japonica Group]
MAIRPEARGPMARPTARSGRAWASPLARWAGPRAKIMDQDSKMEASDKKQEESEKWREQSEEKSRAEFLTLQVKVESRICEVEKHDDLMQDLVEELQEKPADIGGVLDKERQPEFYMEMTTNSAKDEPLMTAATYFWSNTINAFLFNQGPMTPTLIDITMITGLDVTSSANPMSMNTKNQFDFKTKSIGGWSGYVAAYMGQGSVTPREHVAFLLMWLEKFLLCGSSCGPTTNWQFVAEALESKKEFPLGKILLGYLYQMLNNASAKIVVGSVVGAGGPWWLLQTWLNLIVMKVVNRPFVTEAEFPLPEPIVEDGGEERTHRRCMSYGEYASTPTDAGAKLSAELLKDWFCSFYEGLIPNGGGLSPPVIGYHAPKTSTLLHGLTREPADAGKKRKTRSSAVSTLVLAPKKKAKFKKTKPTDKPADDLPALDPSIEQALDEEEIGEDVDQAVAEMSNTEKTPSASPKQTPPTPSAPFHFTRVLADLFSFDIRDYLDEAEEDTSSKALAPLSDDVRKTLEDISHRLEASLDNLVTNCGSIRARFTDIQALLPDDLADALTPAVYLEQHRFKLEKARQRLADRRERKDIEATIQHNRQLVHVEKSKLDQLSEGPIKSNIDRLEARKIDLGTTSRMQR